MKVEMKEYNNEVFGIDLIVEDPNEQDIVQRFWNGGVKINGITNCNKLHLTFKDLVNK